MTIVHLRAPFLGHAAIYRSSSNHCSSVTSVVLKQAVIAYKASPAFKRKPEASRKKGGVDLGGMGIFSVLMKMTPLVATFSTAPFRLAISRKKAGTRQGLGRHQLDCQRPEALIGGEDGAGATSTRKCSVHDCGNMRSHSPRSAFPIPRARPRGTVTVAPRAGVDGSDRSPSRSRGVARSVA